MLLSIPVEESVLAALIGNGRGTFQEAASIVEFPGSLHQKISTNNVKHSLAKSGRVLLFLF